MAEAATLADTYRDQAVLSIDESFLRVSNEKSQVEQDSILAQSLMAEQSRTVNQLPHANCKQLIVIKIDRADLVKNYGLTKMDPYCKLTVAGRVFETTTCYGASTRPVWNKMIRCPVFDPIKNFIVEIMDENQFYADSRIAHANICLPENTDLQKPETLRVALSGQQGEGKEGFLYLQVQVQDVELLASQMVADSDLEKAIDISKQVASQPIESELSPNNVDCVDNAVSNSVYVPTEEEIKQVLEMFPSVEEEVVKSVLEANDGNMMQSINAMLLIATQDEKPPETEAPIQEKL